MEHLSAETALGALIDPSRCSTFDIRNRNHGTDLVCTVFTELVTREWWFSPTIQAVIPVR